jgi:hypothetical protein
VRIALCDADPATADIAQLAGRYGFRELPRFAKMYQAAFGETALATLQRAPEACFGGL